MLSATERLRTPQMTYDQNLARLGFERGRVLDVNCGLGQRPVMRSTAGMRLLFSSMRSMRMSRTDGVNHG